MAVAEVESERASAERMTRQVCPNVILVMKRYQGSIPSVEVARCGIAASSAPARCFLLWLYSFECALRIDSIL